MGSRIMREFYHGKSLRPIVRVHRTEDGKVCLDFLVDSFGGSVGLRVKGSRWGGFDSHESQRALEGASDELGSSVGNDVIWQPKLFAST